MQFDSIIFDLDGTLWDAVSALGKAWAPVLKKFPEIKALPTTLDYENAMGLGPKEFMHKLFPYLSWEKAYPIWLETQPALIDYLHNNGAILYSNVPETLEQLSKNFKLIIVSNCGVGYIEAFLHAHNLSHLFCDLECAGRTKLSKAENIKLVCKRNNLKNAIYVGDTVLDYESAKNAGIPFIHAAYGFGKVDTDKKIYSISELPDLLISQK